jgi:hypothetical protein
MLQHVSGGNLVGSGYIYIAQHTFLFKTRRYQALLYASIHYASIHSWSIKPTSLWLPLSSVLHQRSVVNGNDYHCMPFGIYVRGLSVFGHRMYPRPTGPGQCSF